MPTRVSIIVAVAENGVIGREGTLPWHLPADLRRFKQLTMGHVLLMGRLTYESIGRPLPGRTSLVLSHSHERTFDGCTTVTSWEEALAATPADRELFVIGGQRVFQLALPFATRLHWTAVHAAVEGDVFFPEIDWNQWQLVQEEPHPADDRHALPFTFREWVRR